MVIDFHVHCFPDDLAQRAVPSLAACAGIKPHTDGTVGCIRKSMKKAGIAYSVILSIATKPSQTVNINTWSAEIQGDGIVTFGSIHPQYPDWKTELDRIKRLGIKGLKFHPDYQQFFIDDREFYPFYEYAFSLGFIVLFHAGMDIGLKPPYHCTPERLSALLDAFPGGTIIAAHMGGFSYWDDVEKYLLGKEVYFDTSYSFDRLGRQRMARLILEHGYEKVLFGTDSPWTDQTEGVAGIRSLSLGKNAEEAVLGGNAARLLGI